MKENIDDLEQIIKEEVNKEAEDIRETIQESFEEGELSEDRKDEIHQNLQKQIKEYQKEKVYEQLSEEDREALELGKQIQREEREKQGKKSGWKRAVKISLNTAAVLALVLILGITSVGGPERIVEMVRTMVGEREVIKVNSNEDNLKIAEEAEEEAYQEIKDTFGIEPVKIIGRPDGMEFVRLEKDDTIQIAELFYRYHEKNVVYFINASYTDASWAMDADDKVTDTYYKEQKGTRIEITEYQVADTEEARYSASFKYRGVEYFLIGTMKKQDFEQILNKLHFY